MKISFEALEGLQEVRPLLIEVIKLAEVYYAENDSAHDFDHALRVTRLALKLGQEEGGNLELLALAGILHDTARHEQELTGVCHALRGAEIAREILQRLNYPGNETEHICEMIRTHRFRKGDAPVSLEAKILYDADKLDGIGAIGIGRAYAMGGVKKQKMYTPAEAGDIGESSPEYSPVAEYHYKLRKVVDKMLTPAGKRLALHRHEFMVAFFTELESEIEGKI